MLGFVLGEEERGGVECGENWKNGEFYLGGKKCGTNGMLMCPPEWISSAGDEERLFCVLEFACFCS